MIKLEVFHPLEHLASAIIVGYANPKGWDAFDIELDGEVYHFSKINGSWPRFEKAPDWTDIAKLEFMSEDHSGSLVSYVGDTSKRRRLVVRSKWYTHPSTIEASKTGKGNEVFAGKIYTHKESLDGMAGVEKLTVADMKMECTTTPFMTYYALPLGADEAVIVGGGINICVHVYDMHMKDGSIIPIYESADEYMLRNKSESVVEKQPNDIGDVSEVPMEYDESQALRIVLKDESNNLSTEFLAGIDTYGPGNTMMKEVFIYQLYMLSLYLVQLQGEGKLSQDQLSQFMEGNTFIVPVRSSGGWCYPKANFQEFYEDVVANSPTTRKTLYKLSGSDILLKTNDGFGIITGSSINSSCFVWALCYYFARYLGGSTPLAISIAQTFASSDRKIWKIENGCIVGNTSEVFNSSVPITINDTSSPINRLNVKPVQDSLNSVRFGLAILGYSYDKDGKRDNGMNEHYILVNKTADRRLVVVYDSNRSFGDPKANDVRFSPGKDVTYLMDYVQDKGVLVYYTGSMLSQLFAAANDSSTVVLS